MSKKKNRAPSKSPEVVGEAEKAAQSHAPETNQPDEKTNPLKDLHAYLRSHAMMVGIIGLLAFGAVGSALKYLEEDAKGEIVRRAKNKGNFNNKDERSFLNKINPFLPTPTPTPTPTPQLSKEYLYAGGNRLVAVEDANANAAPPSDLAIWRPSSGDWWVMAGTGTVQVTQGWGVSSDEPVEGDYDGDGKTDFAVFRSSTNYWYLIYSSTGGTASFAFGSSGDQPVPADYDGDGKTDIAVFRNSDTTWYVNYSSTSATVSGVFGSSGDIPAPADYDGDGKADL